MSDSNWSVRAAVIGAIALLTLVALGTGAFFGALNTPHYGYQTENRANRAARSEQRDPSQIDRDRAGLPYFAERIASGPDPQSRQEREQRDLAAQESMSVWAFWLLLVTSAGTLTTMVGTGFLLWQIILTRKAVQDTGDATEAMVEANGIARAAYEAETRPILAIQESRNIESDFIAAFEILVVNHGKVPALVRKAESRVVRTPNARNPSQHPPGQVSLQIEFRKNEIISPNSPVWVRAQIGSLAHSNFWDISGELFLEYSQVVGGDLKLYSTQIEFRAMWVKSVDGQASALQIGRLDGQADGILVELVTPSLAMT